MKEINILGFGTMGKQIAALFHLLDYKVNIYNKTEIKHDDFLKQIKILEKKYSFKSNNQELNFYLGFDIKKDLLTIESIEENLQNKKILIENFKKQFSSPIFSNSSSFSYSDLSCPLIHFFNPIYLNLVEVFDPKDELSSILLDLQSLNFIIIKSKGNRGALANLILFGEISNIFKIIEQLNYSYKECQDVYNTLYEKRNIFNIINTIGIDICEAIFKNIKENDPSFYHPKSFKKALSKGILGRKNKTKIEDLFTLY